MRRGEFLRRMAVAGAALMYGWRFNEPGPPYEVSIEELAKVFPEPQIGDIVDLRFVIGHEGNSMEVNGRPATKAEVDRWWAQCQVRATRLVAWSNPEIYM